MTPVVLLLFIEVTPRNTGAMVAVDGRVVRRTVAHGPTALMVVRVVVVLMMMLWIVVVAAAAAVVALLAAPGAVVVATAGAAVARAAAAVVLRHFVVAVVTACGVGRVSAGVAAAARSVVAGVQLVTAARHLGRYMDTQCT